MFAAETDGFGCWRGRRTVEFRPAIIHLETRLVPNGTMMPPSGHGTDPVTVAAGIDTLAERLGGNLADRFIAGDSITGRQIGGVLKLEARLRTVMHHLEAISGGNPDFERVLTSFRAHDAELVNFASVLANHLRKH
jgi:hypothetical protein